MAADSAIGGVLEKNGDHLPEKTRQILKEVQAKFQSKHGADTTGQSDKDNHGFGHSGAGHDKGHGGHDTVVGGHHDADIGITDFGVMKLPDLAGLKAVGGIDPVAFDAIPSAADPAADAVTAKAAPAAHVDLTLIGQSIDALTKKLSKLIGGN